MNTAIFLILLMASGFFSSSETAFLSLDNLRIKLIERKGLSSFGTVLRLLSDPHKLLVTILVGNTLVNIAASSVLANIFYTGMGEKGLGLSIVVMTIVILLFGEVTPKMYALRYREKVALFAAKPVRFLMIVLAPIRIILSAVSNAIVRAMGIKVYNEDPKITEQEIRALFSLGKKKGIVKQKERDMIENILEFKELNAADIMTPRIHMVALDMNKDRESLSGEIKDSQKSRFPVFVHTIDNVVGIVHAKDVLLDESVPVKDHVRRPFFAPESMKIDDLLEALQKRHTHMAIVTDEYGVTSGVVTIEDILEEIVGEIRDELDFEKPKIKKLDQKNFEVNGQAHLDDVEEGIGLKIETDEVDTIGGYVILSLGEIPEAGDVLKMEGFLITVNDVSKNRITSLNIELI